MIKFKNLPQFFYFVTHNIFWRLTDGPTNSFTTCFQLNYYTEITSDLLHFYSKLKKLSEDSLTKQPEEVFDVLEKLGEG